MEGIWYLTPLSTICQLYRASQFYWCHWWMKPEYGEKHRPVGTSHHEQDSNSQR